MHRRAGSKHGSRQYQVASPSQLARACEQFNRDHPLASAKHIRINANTVLLCSIAIIVCICLFQLVTLYILRAAALCVFAPVIMQRLAALCVHGLARSVPDRSCDAPRQRADNLPVYTILCPLYREASVLRQLVANLRRLDYPHSRLDVKLLVEGDDHETLSALDGLRLPDWIEVVVAPPALPRTKPKALNLGLARARGLYLTIFDAEDRPHPGQLRAALACFETDERKRSSSPSGARLGVVQAPLEIDNRLESFAAAQFALEYDAHFRIMLPALARLGLPIPLGGTSNHFRTEDLKMLGGWDPYNVTEDAELGLRYASAGYRTAVIASTPTREEAPVTLGQWQSQRSRWIKGFLQTWLVLMRRPVHYWQRLGPIGFVSMQASLIGSAACSLAHAPVVLGLLIACVLGNLTPCAETGLLGIGYVTAISLLAAGRLRLSTPLLLSLAPLYWCLHHVPAVRALWGLWRRPHFWAKTEHGRSRMIPGLLQGSQPARTGHPAGAPIIVPSRRVTQAQRRTRDTAETKLAKATAQHRPKAPWPQTAVNR